MTAFRDHVAALDAGGDLLRIDERVHWSEEAAAVAAEAARANGPAVAFEDTPGDVRLVAGAYGGPDGMRDRDRSSWSRLARALGLPGDVDYDELLRHVVAGEASTVDPAEGALAAEPADTDPFSLGLPAIGTDAVPVATLGLLAVRAGGTTRWTPIRGSVHGDVLRAVVPAALATRLDPETPASVALGVPAAALIAAALAWTGETVGANAVGTAGALSDLAVAETAGGVVPASAELLVEGTVAPGSATPEGGHERWELAMETASVAIAVDSISLREDAAVPFTPLGAPLADDLHLTGLAESARLFGRASNYWGVNPVEWIALPAETGLGMCLVASEILYAGFEWQLANTLFSFSRLFDKVLVLDADTPAADLARAFDDVWVKAHPSQDWTFSEPDAPAATATEYRRDGETGSRLYINATWDPRWDEEYIAPRVNFENSFPPGVREFVRDNWSEMGFSSDPE